MDRVTPGSYGMVPLGILLGIKAVGGDSGDGMIITALLMLRRGQYADASVPEIAELAMMSERAVQQHIKKLEACGLLVAERLPGRGGNRKNRYHMGRELMERANLAVLAGPEVVEQLAAHPDAPALDFGGDL